MKKIIIYMFLPLMAILAVSCLKNDIPFPMEVAKFVTFETQHQLSAAVIDEKNLTVTVNLTEQANLRKVHVVDYELSEGAEISKDLTVLDFTNPINVTLKKYHSFEWKIVAKQDIERYFMVAGQVGTSTIDVEGRRVIFYIPKSLDDSKIMVNAMKLGPADITKYDEDLTGKIVDFSKPVKVVVSYHSESELWTLYVAKSDRDVELTQVDAWSHVMWAYANVEEGKESGFEYRSKSETGWHKVAESDIEREGGMIKACIKGLQPTTDYVVRAYSGDLFSNEMEATTEPELTMPNMSFDDWNYDGKLYCPWKEDDVPYWGTGNKGSTTLGKNISIPTTDTWNGKGNAAELQTRFVGIGVVGKLGAGNIYTGDWIRTDGTNGVLNFGRPFTSRPTRLRGHWKYTSVPISHTSSEFTHLKGRPDTAQIYIALTDWDKPYEIRTNPSNRRLFDPNAPEIIAYGTIKTGSSITSWSEFEIELEYRATNRKPKYILIVCAASQLGDYYTGGDGTTLWVDDLSLDWDY